MTRSFSIARETAGRCAAQANGAGVRRGTSGTKARHLDGRIALVARGLWETDRAKLLAQTADCSLRTAKRLLAGGAISFDNFLNLLRSDHGDKFLDAFLADAEPAWWRRRKQVQLLAKLKREQMQHLKRLEQLEISFASDD